VPHISEPERAEAPPSTPWLSLTLSPAQPY
jgi:hypothetical protein